MPRFTAELPFKPLFAAALLALAACTPVGPPPETHGTVAGLQIQDRQPGEGAAAVAGNRVSVHYTGWLYDDRAADLHGTQFDSSRTRGQPFSFVLGAGQVIPGWDEGVAGMKVGGHRQLLIPADKAYGSAGAGGVIPPGASLVFDVELVAIEP